MRDYNAKDISVIIPIHELKDDEVSLLKTALESIAAMEEQPGEVLVVGPKTIKTNLNKALKGLKGVTVEYILNNTGDTSYANQVNIGSSQKGGGLISVLEFDDTYMPSYFKTAIPYLNNEEHGGDLVMPIVVATNETGEFIKYTNETIWAMDFASQIGYLDADSLLNHSDYLLSGCIMRRDIFNLVGRLKPSIKYVPTHEFLLRFSNLGYVIKGIPAAGYIHTFGRPGSATALLTHPDTRPEIEEFSFWFEKAETEYIYKQEREIEFPTK
jgi:hypothetical protein